MIMLTTAGRTALAAGSGLVPIAWFTGYPQLAGLATGCFFALALAVCVTPSPRVDISVSWCDARIVEENVGILRVSAVNHRRRAPVDVSLEVSGHHLTHPMHVTVPVLARGESFETAMETPVLQRAVFQVQSLVVECTDPLGLVHRRRSLACEATLTVHPRTVAVKPRRTTSDNVARPRARRGSGDVFHALREYKPGDDVRLIHWMATARSDKPVVRELGSVDVDGHAVLLDTTPAAHASGSFDEAVRVAASVALGALRTGDAWIITTDGARSRCVDDRSVLDQLAALRLAGDDRRILPIPKRAGAVTVVTGPHGAHARWRALAGHPDVTVLEVGGDPAGRRNRTRVPLLRVSGLKQLPARLQEAGL